MNRALVVIAALMMVVLSTGALICKEKAVEVPRELAIIACTVDEYVTLETGERVLKEEAEANGLRWTTPLNEKWKDLEWHVKDGELECQRVLHPIADEAEEKGAKPLPHDLSKYMQCALAAAGIAPKWNEANPGWAVLAAGCPVPQYSDNGTPDDRDDDYIVGYKLPECPNQIGSLIVRCRFDPSAI